MCCRRTMLVPLTSLLLLAACGAETIALPAPETIVRIDVCAGYINCDGGKHSITERSVIDAIAKAASAHRTGWQTETQMALTTGWFTYPTPQDSAAFYDAKGKAPLVLWFGPGWMGSAVTDDHERKRYFRKATDSEVSNLRAALRLTTRSNRPRSAAVELPR